MLKSGRERGRLTLCLLGMSLVVGGPVWGGTSPSGRTGPPNTPTANAAESGEPAERLPGLGAAAARFPHIPEPLVFDLVRPLGARRGELEINTLVQYPLGGRPRLLEWAPEIEWAFADGYGVEFELPMDNSVIDAYKLAFQGTFGTGFRGRYVHGWQTINELHPEDGRILMDALYIGGYRVDDRWSVLTMTGLRRTALGRGGHNRGLLNVSLFNDLSPNWVVGVETNLEFARRHPNYLLIMPQAHWRISGYYNLQFGLGAEKPPGERFRPALALRLIWER
jgi:hypothetical protein